MGIDQAQAATCMIALTDTNTPDIHPYLSLVLVKCHFLYVCGWLCFITLFRAIAMFCRTNNIMWNIPHIRFEWENILQKIVSLAEQCYVKYGLFSTPSYENVFLCIKLAWLPWTCHDGHQAFTRFLCNTFEGEFCWYVHIGFPTLIYWHSILFWIFLPWLHTHTHTHYMVAIGI